MSPHVKFIAILIVAFVAITVGLRLLKRTGPTLAFEAEANVPYGAYWVYDFKTTQTTFLVLELHTKDPVRYGVFCLTQEDFDYFAKVNSGQIPKEKDRLLNFIWNSRVARSHRSHPITFPRGDYVLFVENTDPSNVNKLPLNLTALAEEYDFIPDDSDLPGTPAVPAQ